MGREANMPGRRPGGRPTKERTAAIDDQVLDGARAAFCRKGFVGTSYDEIAAELGVSKHTIYRRFPNKSALLEAVVERDLIRFRAHLTTGGPTAATPLEAVRQAATRYFEYGVERQNAAFYLFISAEAAFSQEMRERYRRWAEIALEPMVTAVRQAQAAGALRAGDPQLVCAILVDLLEGAVNRVRLRDRTSPDDPSPEQLLDERWTVFVRAMADGRGSSG
jgi:AcrR family transcriptional regulator